MKRADPCNHVCCNSPCFYDVELCLLLFCPFGKQAEPVSLFLLCLDYTVNTAQYLTHIIINTNNACGTKDKGMGSTMMLVIQLLHQVLILYINRTL